MESKAHLSEISYCKKIDFVLNEIKLFIYFSEYLKNHFNCFFIPPYS